MILGLTKGEATFILGVFLLWLGSVAGLVWMVINL